MILDVEPLLCHFFEIRLVLIFLQAGMPLVYAAGAPFKLSTVTFIRGRIRVVAIEKHSDHVRLAFDDPEPGSDTYEVAIRFPLAVGAEADAPWLDYATPNPPPGRYWLSISRATEAKSPPAEAAGDVSVNSSSI